MVLILGEWVHCLKLISQTDELSQLLVIFVLIMRFRNVYLFNQRLALKYKKYNHSLTKKNRSRGYNIIIYHECEGRIEKPVLMIAVWHHEAFLSYPHTNNGLFFLLNTVFIKAAYSVTMNIFRKKLFSF